MRRLGWVLLLPVIWLPLGLVLLVAIPALPWWAWLLGGYLAFRLWRRLRRGPDVELDPDRARYSPIRGRAW